MRHARLPGRRRIPRAEIPDDLNDYHWFCLEHVRAYNAGWDFYKGMSPAEVEAQLRADTSWQRPTWPIGSLGHARLGRGRAEGPAAHPGRRADEDRRSGPTRIKAPAELREPLATLGLPWPTTLDAVKSATRNWRSGIIPTPTAAAATPRNA